MIQCIDHVNIVVSDLNAATEFFLDIGFQVQHEGNLSGEWISKIVGLEDVKARFVALGTPDSEMKLELIEYHSPTSPQESQIGLAHKIGFRHIAFRVGDIASVVSALKKKNIEFLSEIQTYEPM